MRKYVILIALMISGCHSIPTQTQTIRFDNDVELITHIDGSGGALGEERYRVSYRFDDKVTLFFEGVNPSYFEVAKSNNAVEIIFCNGTVSRAVPIYLGEPRGELIRLKLDMACEDREQNSVQN